MEIMYSILKRFRSLKLISLALILLTVTACANNSGEEIVSTDTPVSSGEGIETEVQTPIAETSLCTNAYYPVVEGGTWNYFATVSTGDNYSFTNTITSTRSDGFTLTIQFDDLTLTQEWTCSVEGILAIQMGGGNAGLLTTGDTRLELETRNVSGVTYPSEILPGSTWNYSLDFTGTMNIAGQTADVSGDTQSNYTAIGIESVTVPAGTFDAIKIEIPNTINITSTFQGTTVPITVNGTTTSWFAQGIGWIRSVSSSDFGGIATTETIELQWYNIP
jgi:hypothetical protein